MEPTPLAFFGGKFIPVAEAKVGVMTHALHYGTAVFEGIRGNWNPEEGVTFIFRPREHFVRFLQGCSVLRIHIPHSADDLVRLTVELVERSGFREDLYIRPLAFKAAQRVANLKLHELEDDFTLIAVPFGKYLEAGVLRCVTASWRRMDETMIPPRVKISGLYVNSILAKTDAVLAGYDEAILLNQDGHVAEGSGENLFLVKDRVLITPPMYSNILGGITRDCVMQLASHELNLETVERPIGRSELYLADEVFLTGTAAHLTPVGEIDNRKIADGEPGPVASSLQEIYFQAIRGRNPKYRHWCTPAVPARLAAV
ncbi:MAG: branched-chain amino acid transaminase [Chloroflexi bacterium]|nr:branched-chain amino acid transaminase [Chloroflexota bacterium]